MTATAVKPDKRLTMEENLNVKYCVPTWLRDEQILQNNARIKGRITPSKPEERGKTPIAAVNFGPSLNDTWEKLRDYEFIITCSGAHKFLIDRGIIPTFHIDVDPRPHKAVLIGTPHPDVEYLIASTCHSKVFDLLEGHTVKLWHIFDSTEEGLRVLPPGEWAVTGGCSAGLRCMSMARFLGFTNLHIFGMDGCEGASGKHAAEHPNQPKGHAELEYEGKSYRTTSAMLEAAKQTWHELDMMEDVEPTFFGEGLVQAMAKNYVRKPAHKHAFVAYSKPELISAEYRALNESLHQKNLAYGVGGGKHADVVKKIYKILQKTTEFVSVLDYGAGKGYLAKALPFPIAEYDPAVPGKMESPKPADLVVCTDVLEHIEPECIRLVLADIRRCVKQVGYFTICTTAARKTLPDGRNTHLIQKDKDWWQYQLAKHFEIGRIEKVGGELYVTVGPLKKKNLPAMNTVQAHG